jgi:outer membrane receptor protein involved in Fe transport
MDNQAPGLNFSVGNIIGLSDLDVDNVELLPGAASALYGAGGINGTLLMTSKNPFDYQGLSFQYKTGINHVNDNNTGVQPYNQFDARIAKAWNNKFGIKASFSYLKAEDWYASDTRNFDRKNNRVKLDDRASDPNYDGINVYGDEVSQNIRNVVQSGIEPAIRQGILAASQGQFDPRAALGNVPVNAAYPDYIAFINQNVPAGLRPAVTSQYLPFFFGLRNQTVLPDQFISRDGYNEADLIDYGASSLKLSGAAHYKFNDNLEAIAQANWGTGTSVYTGTERYSLRNFSIGQYKLELKGKDFFLRGYTTQERSGDSYIAAVLGLSINEVSSTNSTWFPAYISTYLGGRLQGQTDQAAHAAGRTAANATGKGRFAVGSDQFNAAKEQIMNTNISDTRIDLTDPSKSVYGARFDDRTNLYHYEGMYNFTNLLDNVVELQVGASSRLYQLRSNGTIFSDLDREIDINEYGAFAQLGKKLLDDKLKLTLAGRFDKSTNFKGRFTPRIAGVYTVAENNNIRLSYQTGYRNPTTQNQYIDLSVLGGQSRLIGGIPESLSKNDLYNNKGILRKDYNAYLASAAAGTPDPSILTRLYTFDAEGLRPESVQSFELGYKGLIDNRLLIDAYGYYNTYTDFITAITLYRPSTGTGSYSIPVNARGDVNTYGAALGLDYLIGKYTATGNVSYNQIGDLPAEYDNDFNTPTVRYNLGLSNREIVKNVGANIQYRWQDGYNWFSSFAAGPIPAFSTVDAQVNFKVPAYKSVIKVGGSNLLNKYYRTSFGNPEAGALYYVSLTYNP